MYALHELKEKLCRELDQIAEKEKMASGDLEIIHKLTDTIKNIDKIIMLEDDGYSQAGEWDMEGRLYGRGNSYANRGKHYVRGHYSRADGGRGGSRGSRGGYSRGDGRERMMEHLERMMDQAGGDREREIIQRCMTQMESI